MLKITGAVARSRNASAINMESSLVFSKAVILRVLGRPGVLFSHTPWIVLCAVVDTMDKCAREEDLMGHTGEGNDPVRGGPKISATKPHEIRNDPSTEPNLQDRSTSADQPQPLDANGDQPDSNHVEVTGSKLGYYNYNSSDPADWRPWGMYDHKFIPPLSEVAFSKALEQLKTDQAADRGALRGSD